MSLKRYPLSVHKGEDFSLTVVIKIDGVVLDLSGASVYAQIRKLQKRGATKIDDFVVKVDGVAVTNPATTNNEIELSLTDTQTAAIDENEGWYDLLVVNGTGDDTYYMEGKITFYDSVTVKP